MSTEYETTEPAGVPEIWADYAEVQDDGEVVRLTLVSQRDGRHVVVQRVVMARSGFLRSLLAAVGLILPGLRSAVGSAARMLGH